MTELKVIGQQQIGEYNFTGIEGGFGEGKKAMLVKDIAEIHGKQVKAINQAINMNRKRFNDGVDIIDILGVNQIDPKDFGYSQQAINSYMGLKSKGLNSGIYLLSERGYAKLLKILEDDTAWKIYDQLVDGYFEMREQLDTSELSPELQIMQSMINQLAKQEVAQQVLETGQKQLKAELDGMKETVTVNIRNDWRKQTTQLINQIANRKGRNKFAYVKAQIFSELESRAGINLSIRLQNKKTRMKENGATASAIQHTTKVDVIADSRQLIEIYIAIIKELAIGTGVYCEQLENIA